MIFQKSGIEKYQIPFAVILLLFLSACKESPVSQFVDVLPGSRNYTWQIDTVHEPYNLFIAITGTSPTDVWTANSGDPEKLFYHFDGTKWATDLISRPFSASSIYSLNQSSVWSAGYGEIWHYNGAQWEKKYRHTIVGYSNISFEDIRAFSETDIYAVGQYYTDTTHWGLIVHYDGNSWKQIEIPKIRTAFAQIRKDASGKIYLWGVTNERFIESTYQFYEFDGKTLTQIKSGTQANDQLGTLLELGNRVYFIIGYDFCDYENGKFIKIGLLSDLPQFINAGVGRSTEDIFIGLLDGIAHYNGQNTEYLVHFGERVAITGF